MILLYDQLTSGHGAERECFPQMGQQGRTIYRRLQKYQGIKYKLMEKCHRGQTTLNYQFVVKFTERRAADCGGANSCWTQQRK